MRCSLAVALFIAPLMRGLAPLSAQAALGTEAEIRALERESFEAARAADTAAFSRLMASDEREVISNGSVHGPHRTASRLWLRRGPHAGARAV